MKDQQPEQDAIDLGQALRALRRRLPLIVLCVAVVAGAAFAFSKQQTKEYTATASLQFGGTNDFAQRILGLTPTGSTGQAVEQASNVELVSLGSTAAKTAKQLGMTEAEVSSSIDAATSGESTVVGISATSISPSQAARIANAYARQYVGDQARANHSAYLAALALVEKQLSELPTDQRFGEAAVSLQNRAQTLRLLDGTHYGNVRFVGHALPPSSPSSPDVRKNVALGALIGLLIGLGLALVLERFERERWIRGPKDLETIYGLPLLGTVPVGAGGATGAGSRWRRDRSRPAEIEAFQILRARLRFFGADRTLNSILVASAAPGEGTTTIASGLAEAAVRMGSHALLIDASLRSPDLSRGLGLGAAPGLSDVLTGAVSMGEAVRTLDPVHFGGGPMRRRLSVLPSGLASTANAAELLERHAMHEVLRYAKNTFDLVVIDVAPLATQAEGLSLLPRVDGVVIVGRVGRGRRDLAEELNQILGISGVHQLGVVANGVGSRPTADLTADVSKADPLVDGSGGAGVAPTGWASHEAAPER